MKVSTISNATILSQDFVGLLVQLCIEQHVTLGPQLARILLEGVDDAHWQRRLRLDQGGTRARMELGGRLRHTLPV